MTLIELHLFSMEISTNQPVNQIMVKILYAVSKVSYPLHVSVDAYA